MKNRFRSMEGMRGLPVTFGTFHGIYYGILKWAYRFDQSNLLRDEEKFQIISHQMEETGWDEYAQSGQLRDIVKEIAEEIGNVKNQGCSIDTYMSMSYQPERFRRLYLGYEEQKKTMRKIDFEDMLILCRDLFVSRPDILRKWQQKFRYILVDEFQDINQVQYDVIRMLAAPEHNLFVVGDDDQSVYRFRGARPGIMRDFM